MNKEAGAAEGQQAAKVTFHSFRTMMLQAQPVAPESSAAPAPCTDDAPHEKPGSTSPIRLGMGWFRLQSPN